MKNFIRAFFFAVILLFAIAGGSLVAAGETPPAAQATTGPAQAPAALPVEQQFPEQPSAAQQEILRSIFGEQDQFVYSREGRPEPFLPFVQEKAVQQEIKKEEGAVDDLSGLRQFEPNQLLLVAILFRGGRPLAMVQDPVGKGYVVRVGTAIGRHGTVEEIVQNMVIVKQATRTWDQEVYKRVEMVMRKEGEH